MKSFLFLFIASLVSSNAFMMATRAVKSPGFSLSALKKKPTTKKTAEANTTAKKEWRIFGRDRDSKAPPAFLNLYNGNDKLGKYPELKAYEKPGDYVQRNPYKNNAPVA